MDFRGYNRYATILMPQFRAIRRDSSTGIPRSGMVDAGLNPAQNRQGRPLRGRAVDPALWHGRAV